MKKLIVIILIILVAVGLFRFCGNPDESQKVLSFDEMKELCATYDYDELAAEPEKYKGEYAVFTGQVEQLQEDGASVVMRIDVSEKPGKTPSKALLVEYIYKEGEDHIREEGMVTVYGVLDGTRSYKSVDGNKITLPALIASYVVLAVENENEPETSTSESTEPPATRITEPFEPTETTVAASDFDEDLAHRKCDIQSTRFSDGEKDVFITKITNKSPYNLAITVEAYNKDLYGEVLFSDTDTARAVAIGQTIYIELTETSDDKDFTRYYIHFSEELEYDCILTELNYEAEKIGNYIYLKVTNNAAVTARNTLARVVMVADSNINFYDTADLGDIAPGETVEARIPCNVEYEDMDVAFTSYEDEEDTTSTEGQDDG